MRAIFIRDIIVFAQAGFLIPTVSILHTVVVVLTLGQRLWKIHHSKLRVSSLYIQRIEFGRISSTTFHDHRVPRAFVYLIPALKMKFPLSRGNNEEARSCFSKKISKNRRKTGTCFVRPKKSLSFQPKGCALFFTLTNHRIKLLCVFEAILQLLKCKVEKKKQASVTSENLGRQKHCCPLC